MVGRRDRGSRLQSARGRSASSARWLERQLADPYVRRAKAEGYRARAAYKLLELDDRFHLLRNARRIVDLGAAPGSWSQVARVRAPSATIVAVDILPITPLPGVETLELDILAPDAAAAIEARLGGPADLVLSDMAANSIGHPRTDQLRTLALVEAAAGFAARVLRPGGALVAKVLGSGAGNALVAELKRRFESVRHAKPPASRRDSSETYLVAQGFEG
ncbi:RlmE family RNA methyltransferase [Thermaurantiacus sp.]